jgi:hypothetical protein
MDRFEPPTAQLTKEGERMIELTNPISFTEEHERLVLGWPTPLSAGDFISFYGRAGHARRRLFDDHPMAIQSIAAAAGLPMGLLTEAWHRYHDLYSFPVTGADHRQIAERWLGLVIRALDALDALGQHIPMLGVRPELRQPEACNRILRLLGQRPGGAAGAIAACMVLSATTPEETQEAETRRLLAEPKEPKLIRELGDTGWVRQLWRLQTPRHAQARRFDVVLVEYVAGDTPKAPADVIRRLVVADPEEPSAEGLRLGTVTVARGRRQGGEIGKFRADRRHHLAPARTSEALTQLALTGELPPTGSTASRPTEGDASR